MSTSTKRVWIGSAAAAVAVLIFGSVQTTDALWKDSAVSANQTVTAGRLALSSGSGAGPGYTFDALTGSLGLVGDFVQKPLTIVNTGTADLEYKLSAAGLSVSAGPSVTVGLTGTVVSGAAACTATGTPVGTPAFTPFQTSATSMPVTSAPRSLLIGASEVWCIRSTLLAASTTASSTYTHLFSFGAVST